MTGKVRNPVYTDAFLERHGAARHSSIIMTPSGFLTDEAWIELVPKLIRGIREKVRSVAVAMGISVANADKLQIGLTFDGFKSHLKNLLQLVMFRENGIICCVENRDSSEINQAFDRFVAKAGKKQAAVILDELRRSHVTPIITQWTLVMVGLTMLRDCDASNVWESSFMAVNMHPLHRIGVEDWIAKINNFVRTADKFADEEVLDLSALLPAGWLKVAEPKRQRWLRMIKEDGESWDVSLISKLRKDGMPLSILANIFKIYHAEQRLNETKTCNNAGPATPTPTTQTVPKKVEKGAMIYHLFKVPGSMMTPEQKFQHAITVRNRTLGPDHATTISPHLDVEVTPDNERFLSLKPEDINMYNVLRQSSCKHGRRRKIAKRTLNALGGLSGKCGILNEGQALKDIKQGLKFAASYEEAKHAEKQRKLALAHAKKKQKEENDRKRAERAQKALAKLKKVYTVARKKLAFLPEYKFYQRHVKHLSGSELKVCMLLVSIMYRYTNHCLCMQAVAYFECCEKKLNGKVDEMRAQLKEMLPVGATRTLAFPEYETQDPDAEYVSEATEGFSGNESESAEAPGALLSFSDLKGGEMVEVWWQGEKQWYLGKITGIEQEGEMFEIHYSLDDQRLWHYAADYSVRLPLD